MRILYSVSFIVALLWGSETFAISGNRQLDYCERTLMELLKPRQRYSHLYSTEKAIIDPKVKETLLDHARANLLKQKNIELLSETLDSLQYKIPEKNLRYYITFVENIRLPKRRAQAIKDLVQLTDKKPDSKYVQKFLRGREQIKKKVIKEKKRFHAKLKERHPDYPPEKLKAKTDFYGRRYRDKYNEVFYGCRSPRPNDINKNAAKHYKNFTIGIEMASGLFAYHYQNQDKEWNLKFYGQLGFEIIAGYIGGLINAKILTNPSNSWVKKGIQKFFFSRIYSLFQIPIFTFFFDGPSEKYQKKMEEFMNNPNNKEEAKKLKEFLSNPRYYDEFKQYVNDYFGHFAGKVGLDIEPELKVDDVDWDNLTKEDLERDDIKDLIMAAIMARSYEENVVDYVRDESVFKTDMHLSGDVGADRWNFHTAYAALMLPRDTLVQWFIYHTLCMNQLNPKLAIGKALGIFTINRFVMDQFYHWSKREFINQPVE